MDKRRIQIAVVLGVVAIMAIISFQYVWLKEAFSQEKRKFNQSVHIALLEVVKLVVNDNHSQFPQTNPVQKISDDYYLVKINDEIDAKILEFYLKNEFEKLNIKSDFEYALYDCRNDEMVYGNYVSLLDRDNPKPSKAFFPKMEGLVYYFAIRFQDQPVFLSRQTGTWTIIAIISLIVLAIYIYSVFVILRQNKYYELQKDFINNMTHEFKTPLSSIMIASQYIKDDPVLQKNERLEKYSSALLNQSKRLNDHVERILTLTKSEKKSIRPVLSTILLNEVIGSTIDHFKLQHEGNTSVDLKIPNKNILIRADRNQLINLINNLLDNAFKYGGKPPEIKVKVEAHKKIGLLSIQDNGKGIPLKFQQKVFNKFFRVPLDDAELKEGFGLGLYYVKNICKFHNWKISLECELGIGSTFTIKIPIYE